MAEMMLLVRDMKEEAGRGAEERLGGVLSKEKR